MMDETLKPCPCCGAPAEMRRSRAGDDFVKCTNPSCGLRTKNCHENEAGARLVWNERAGDAELRALVRDMFKTLTPAALKLDEFYCGTIYRAHVGIFEKRMEELEMIA